MQIRARMRERERASTGRQEINKELLDISHTDCTALTVTCASTQNQSEANCSGFGLANGTGRQGL